ncbi:MAG: hypothetical protein A2015_08865 [Spirochaetes bacterium GWF1_31_7]|nr:MAG: hypothetical protein A2Y30_06795 [Spirochaetes bacterium GWE1_32_154]OHD48031.1 MAG: hypothetical protein A2015_08865 [Spirochaetes bacterium GWF1_31_7]OHD49652.1 MAG: hypothetical protein A2Y29_06770 [Spirochaetes bacterium GWE2_31_10]OHD80060.1 MAG: hypothetical protein A2355_09405 [Spirochaetes bacterium RIFOXYB1_FULL_32_8]HBD96205.1 chemotaxis protein CheW [Spirochaetia bacterium]
MSEVKVENEQYLTFVLDNETYAFDVLKTKEVLNLVKITPIPRTPSFMAGVINLRGSVVPVINLREKFSMKPNERTIDTSVIIVEVLYGKEVITIGALVDAVKAVVRFDESQKEPPPKIGMQLNVNLIHSIAKSNTNFVMILNADNVFSEKELSIITAHIPSDDIESVG